MNTQTIDRRNIYGTIETNGLVNGPQYHIDNANNEHPDYPDGCDWTTKGLQVTRLRLLTDSYCPFWDVSYCDGLLDGKFVRVILPFGQLKRGNLAAQIIDYAKRDGVYAKGLGILNCISTLK